jgi:arylsulfatase
MSKDETIDVLMAGYLSKEAALDDFNAIKATGADLIGLVILDKDLEGNVSIDLEDHAVATGAKKLGGVGLVVGLFAPPLLAATAVGALVGAGVGKVAHKKIEAGIKEGAQDAIPIGGAALIAAYHPPSSAAVDAAVTRAIKRADGEATGPHKVALKAAMADARQS